jgi:hypothetical protein
MKKSFSILLASFLFLSGMHLSIASHYCGKELAAMKWSFSGELATCGMEAAENSSSGQEYITSACCHNQLSFYSVDNNYNITSLQLQEPIFKVVLQLFAPLCLLSHTSTNICSNFTNVFPPGLATINSVSLPDICVFRI